MRLARFRTNLLRATLELRKNPLEFGIRSHPFQREAVLPPECEDPKRFGALRVLVVSSAFTETLAQERSQIHVHTQIMRPHGTNVSIELERTRLSTTLQVLSR